jgi:hypothetical protein
MNAFLNQMMDDLRHGRESWRVMLVMSSAALAITVSALQLHH